MIFKLFKLLTINSDIFLYTTWKMPLKKSVKVANKRSFSVKVDVISNNNYSTVESTSGFKQYNVLTTRSGRN
jgi:hypothetical protein